MAISSNTKNDWQIRAGGKPLRQTSDYCRGAWMSSLTIFASVLGRFFGGYLCIKFGKRNGRILSASPMLLSNSSWDLWKIFTSTLSAGFAQALHVELVLRLSQFARESMPRNQKEDNTPVSRSFPQERVCFRDFA